MFQVGKEVAFDIGAASECKQSTDSDDCDFASCGTWSECKSVDTGTGADSCTETPNTSCYDAQASVPECRALQNRKSAASLTYSKCKTGG
jgi:hypothetical protein